MGDDESERHELEQDEEEGSESIQELPNGNHVNGVAIASAAVGAEELEEEEEEEGRGPSLSSSSSSLAFPVSRVRRLIKSESDIQMVGMEAIFAIAKAAEFFLEQFVEESFDNMAVENRTTLAYKDLSSAVASAERLEFLADFVPEKVPASKALAEAPFQIC